jgi:hypothetical protein
MFEGGLVTSDRQALLDFEMQSADLYRAVMGANKARGEIQARIDHLLKAAVETPSSSEEQAQTLRALNTRMQELAVRFDGDSTIASRQEPVPMSLTDRVSFIVGGHWDSESAVTENYRNSYLVADQQLRAAISELHAIEADLVKVEAALQAEGAPWTPGRIPEWPR